MLKAALLVVLWTVTTHHAIWSERRQRTGNRLRPSHRTNRTPSIFGQHKRTHKIRCACPIGHMPHVHTHAGTFGRHRHRSRSSSLASAPPPLKAIPVCLRYAVTVLKMLPYQRKSGWNGVSKALTDWVCAFPVRSVVAVCTRRYITLTLCRRCRQDK